MDSCQDSLQCCRQQIWQAIDLIVQADCLIVENKGSEISFIPFYSENLEKNRMQVTAKAHPAMITLEATLVQKISQEIGHQLQFYLNLAQETNKLLVTDDVVFWVEQNRNFTVRKTIMYEFFRQLHQSAQQFLKNSLLNFQSVLENCKNQSINSYLSARNKAVIESKINLLQHLKFQFEANRRKRPKATTIDFNTSKIKSISELIALKHTCEKQNKNYMAALRFNQLRSSLNPKQALANYTKAYEAHKKQQQKQKVEEFLQQRSKILNPIKIRCSEQICEHLEGTFSHIEVVQSEFSIIFSLNLKTTQFINRQLQDNGGFRDQNCVLVKKKKCSGCQGESQVRKKINQSVFENEIEMLILLNPFYHSSICNFYVQQYTQRKQIRQIYSKKLPYDPIQRFLQDFEKANPLKSLKNLLIFLTQVAEGIQFLSSHEAIHRDLKPTNILMDWRNMAKIIDFGSACPTFQSALQKSLTKNFDMKLRSTKGYYFRYSDLPTEVASKYTKQEYERHVNFDVYSLGAIIQFFMPTSLSVKQKYYPEVKDNIDFLVKKCKDIHPEDRLTPLEATLFLKELVHLCQKLTQYD